LVHTFSLAQVGPVCCDAVALLSTCTAASLAPLAWAACKERMSTATEQQQQQQQHSSREVSVSFVDSPNAALSSVPHTSSHLVPPLVAACELAWHIVSGMPQVWGVKGSLAIPWALTP